MVKTAFCCRTLLLFSLLIVLVDDATAQVYWDGGAEDGQWSTAANWSGDVVPSASDQVILDNSIVAVSYIVMLPAGTTAVAVKTLTLSPATGTSIQVILPATNTSSSAFSTTGPGYGLIINSGGTFKNSSGASGGNTVTVSDSLRINNGGRYIHNTARSHASLVTVLSKAAGTETGIFEFDVPGASNFIISLSGRTYGTLALSAATAGGLRSYSSSGVQPVTIRGELIIGAGVRYGVSLGGSFIIKGNLVQHGGIFNVANSTANTFISLQGDLIQHSGIITEDDVALPTIQLNGTVNQNIFSAGTITESVTLSINNSAGVTLQSPVSLPYKLALVNGKVKTTSTNLLTLKAGCSIVADSLSNDSFINGPLRKEGFASTDHFLFPVGKDVTLRWLALKNATGNFIVEFFKSSPRTVSTSYNTGIDHISGLEYWTVEADATPTPSANVELSFVDPNSGGVTSMSSLRVAQYTGTGWADAGNSSVTGTPGSRGSVTGNAIVQFGPGAGYFTLASSDAANPLPAKWMNLGVHTQHDQALLSWTVAGDIKAGHFEIMASGDNRTYLPVSKVLFVEGQHSYYFKTKLVNTGATYYRISLVEEDGMKTFSKILPVLYKVPAIQLLSVAPSVVHDRCLVQVLAAEAGYYKLSIINSQGQLVKVVTTPVQQGWQQLPIDVTGLLKGMYSIRVISNKAIAQVARFVKL